MHLAYLISVELLIIIIKIMHYYKLFFVFAFLLQKKYKWNPALLISVKDTWKHVASVRYNDKLGKWRKKYGKDAKPNIVPQEVWNKWWEYWNSEEFNKWWEYWNIEEFKALSQKASHNRRSEKAGEHIGGSKTTIQHSIDLVKVFFQFNFVVNFVYAKNTNYIKICHVHNMLILFIFRRLS